MEDRGLEQPSKTPQKPLVGEGAARNTARSDLDRVQDSEELFAIGERLDVRTRKFLLAVARGLESTQVSRQSSR